MVTGILQEAARTVRVRGLSKSYGSRRAVDDVSFEIEAGEVFGLIGPNGAGKTSTLECLVGMRRIDAGEVQVCGFDPAERATSTEFRRSVAVQPQEGTLFPNLKVGETLELWASFYPDPLPIDEVVALVGLADQREQRVRALSGGQRRRLLLGLCVVGRARLLVLDEPAAGLDPQARELLWDVVRRHRDGGGSVLLTTHDMNEAAQLCDRIGVIVRGRLVAQGTPAELVRERGGRSTVSVTVDEQAVPGAMGLLRMLPGVTQAETSVRGRSATLRITTSQADAVLKRIAAADDWNARDILVSHGGLDEVFRSLVAETVDA